MLDFNDQNIFVGYIKQLLYSFNLPRPIIYKEDYPMYFGSYYLYKDNFIICTSSAKANQVTPNNYKILGKYSENIDKLYFQDTSEEKLVNKLKNPNLIRHLKLNSLIYDSYTHNYLGDYLRFLRDYKHLNLMSLYNCFSNEMPSDLSFSVNSSSTFDTSDTSYKIYMLPVKFYKNYIIAIDSDYPVEIACGLYGKVQSTTNAFISPTYVKYSRLRFNHPIIYSKLKEYSLEGDETSRVNIVHNIKDLKMFIKVSASNNSSIVILENEASNGNEGNSFIFKDSLGESGETICDKFPTYNRAVCNIEYNKDYSDIILPTQSQLLKINSGINYPFADRLIEYLIDNPITNMENIPDNIKRLQKELQARYDITFVEKYKDYNIFIRRDNSYIADKESASSVYLGKSGFVGYSLNAIKDSIDKKMPGKYSPHLPAHLKTISNYGIWDPKYRLTLYNLAIQTGLFNNTPDILGYVDKDIESKLGNDIDIYGGNN